MNPLILLVPLGLTRALVPLKHRLSVAARRTSLVLLALLLPATAAAAVSVKEFGAVGDGRADDTKAIQAALDSGQNVIVPEGTYRITNALTPREHQVLEINGTIKISDAHIQSLTADTVAGQPRIPVKDASRFYPGQWVTLGDEGLGIQGGGKHKVRREGGDCGRIARIEGNTLVMELNLKRSYTLAGKAKVATQPSAILITCSNVHVRGRGVIDANKAGQFNFAPADMTATPKQSRGEDTRAGCGITVDAHPDTLSHISIEGVTVKNAVLHNISFFKVKNASISGVTAIGAYDKNILLRYSEACRIIGNQCLDSEFEDGIILYQGNQHCVVQGNICTGNARMGICVNASQTGIVLSGNICANNRLNYSIRGNNGSSTGDFSAGSRVNIEGRGNVVTNLVSLGPVLISATDLTFNGGIIAGEEGKPLDLAMSIARNGDDRRVALVDRVRIRNVTFRECKTAVQVSGVVKDVHLMENRFQSSDTAVRIADECRGEVRLSGNIGYATEGAGSAKVPAAARKITVAHGLQVVPKLTDISVTPTGPLGHAKQFWIGSPTASGFDILVDAEPGASGASFVWRIAAGR